HAGFSFVWTRAATAAAPLFDRGLAAIQQHRLAVSEHHAFEPDDLLAVAELLPDSCQHVTGLDGCLRPAVGFHPVDGGAADLPSLHPSVVRADFERDHRVRVLPDELGDGALYRDKLAEGHRPGMVGEERSGAEDDGESDDSERDRSWFRHGMTFLSVTSVSAVSGCVPADAPFACRI